MLRQIIWKGLVVAVGTVALSLVVLCLSAIGGWTGGQVYASNALDTPQEIEHWCDEGNGTIQGRIISASGASIEHMTVVLYRSSGHGRDCEQDVGADGTFQFTELPTGTYQLEVYDWETHWHTKPITVPIELTTGATVDLGDVVVETTPDIVSINGTVVDSNGAVVTDIDACVYLTQVTTNVSASSQQGTDGSSDDGHGHDGHSHDSCDHDYDDGGDHHEDGHDNGDHGHHGENHHGDNHHGDNHHGNNHHGNNHEESANVANGTFRFNAWADSYKVSLRIKRGGPYFVPVAQEILVDTSDGLSKTVTIPVERYSVTISGTLLLSATGAPAIDVGGRVRAVNVDDNTKVVAKIDSDTGQYQLYLNPDTWRIDYNLRTDDYLPFNPEAVTVTAGANESLTQNFTLAPLDTTIRGTVTDANGNPMDHARIVLWPAHNVGAKFTRLKTHVHHNGEFELSVASGYSYVVNAFATDSTSLVQPAPVTIIPTANATNTVDIQFLDPNATISGLVTLDDGSTASHAQVVAQSSSGQVVRTHSDSTGTYRLDVVNGLWDITAKWHSHPDHVRYNSADELQVDLSATSTATVDITLLPLSTPMSQTVQGQFTANSGWAGTLSNGMKVEIPAGAMPADGDVSISISSMGDGLPATIGEQPINSGYSIEAWDSQTGQPIERNFRSAALITLPYHDADVQRAGVAENAVSPAYYDAAQNRWITVDTFTQNSVGNQITVQTDHFSLWALVAQVQPSGALLDPQLHLPVILR